MGQFNPECSCNSDRGQIKIPPSCKWTRWTQRSAAQPKPSRKQCTVLYMISLEIVNFAEVIGSKNVSCCDPFDCFLELNFSKHRNMGEYLPTYLFGVHCDSCNSFEWKMLKLKS